MAPIEPWQRVWQLRCAAPPSSSAPASCRPS